METVLQRFQKVIPSEFEIAKKYYKIIFEINDVHVTERELDLIAYSAVHGTISTPPVRDEFMKEFNVPKGSIYNISSKLQKMNILVKDNENKIRVNPIILPDFSKPELLLIIKIRKNAQ